MSMTRLIRAYTPVRVCDFGGWTDTWFAWNGAVTSIAVDPGIECLVRVRPGSGVEVFAENFSTRFTLGEGKSFSLIEAAIEAVPLPPDVAIEISVFSPIPPGASMGTSASVLVAIISALDLLTPGTLAHHEIARLAHQVEASTLQRQSGVQDQFAAVYGGINFIEVTGYPNAQVSPLRPSEQFMWELETRLTTFFMGSGHDSSDIHSQVIKVSESGSNEKTLDELRDIAHRAKSAIVAEDMGTMGELMRNNTACQQALHASLVSEAALIIQEIALKHGGLGIKVNGAGGGGGTVTVLGSADHVRQRQMVAEIVSTLPQVSQLNTRLNRTGVRRWQSS
jgi:D-glycero-alpha-D-manno-heptose-7-phosphate kinase